MFAFLGVSEIFLVVPVSIFSVFAVGNSLCIGKAVFLRCAAIEVGEPGGEFVFLLASYLLLSEMDLVSHCLWLLERVEGY